MEKRKYLLVIGIQRSGTSLLASYLGAHPDVNMLYENMEGNIVQLYGKPWCGNKVITNQIHLTMRATRPIRFINKILSPLRTSTGLRRFRSLPRSFISVRDYVEMGSHIIKIYRDENEIIHSMVNRGGYSIAKAKREYSKGMTMLNSISGTSINYKMLVQKPQDTLQKLCNEINLTYSETMLRGRDFNYVYLDKRNNL